MVTDGMKARVQAFQAFCSLISGTELVVVQKIIFSYLGRGEIGHDHICPGKDPLFPAVFRDGAQRCGGGQQVSSFRKSMSSARFSAVWYGEPTMKPVPT